MDLKTLRKHEDKILLGLVDFYFERGYTSHTYQDPDKGGLYENKLGHQLGYAVTSENLPAPEFIAPARSLEEQGYVRRIKRQEGSELRGIWPTLAGLKRVEYLRAHVWRKVVIVARDHSTNLVISAITTVVTTLVTLMIARFLGLFGLGK